MFFSNFEMNFWKYLVSVSLCSIYSYTRYSTPIYEYYYCTSIYFCEALSRCLSPAYLAREQVEAAPPTIRVFHISLGR